MNEHVDKCENEICHKYKFTSYVVRESCIHSPLHIAPDFGGSIRLDIIRPITGLQTPDLLLVHPSLLSDGTPCLPLRW